MSVRSVTRDANADLFFACVKGDLAGVERALAQGAEHSRPEEMSGIPPLSWAVRSGHLDCAVALAKAGASPWERGPGPSEIKSAMGVAMQFKRYDILQALIDHGKKPSLHHRSYEFSQAVRSEKIPAMRMFIKEGASVDEPWAMGEASPLSVAVGTKNEESVRLILESGAMVDRGLGANQSSASLKAVERGWPEGLKMLLQAGANPDGIMGDGALAHAALGRHAKGQPGINLELLTLLDSFGAQVASKKFGPKLLSTAMLMDDEAAVRWLCDKGVDPEWAPSEGSIPSAAIHARMTPGKPCSAYILGRMGSLAERSEISKQVQAVQACRPAPRI